MLVDSFTVDSPDVVYHADHITSSYVYDTTSVGYNSDGSVTVRPKSERVEFQTCRKVPKVGCGIRRIMRIVCTHWSGIVCCMHSAAPARLSPVARRLVWRA